MYIYFSVCVCVHACIRFYHRMHVTDGGQLAGVSLLLPPCVLGIQLSVAAEPEANLPTISQVCLCMFTVTSNTLLQPQTTLHFAVHARAPTAARSEPGFQAFLRS